MTSDELFDGSKVLPFSYPFLVEKSYIFIILILGGENNGKRFGKFNNI